MLFTVATTAVISASFAAQASANTHKVEPGDTLWSISKKYDVSISELKQMNNLRNTVIFPRQQLVVTKNPASVPTDPKPSPPAVPVAENGKTYTIKSGDTLIRIANSHSISLSDLKKWNQISSHIIYPGQKLTVSASTSSQVKEPSKTEEDTTKNENNVPPVSKPQNVSYSVKSGDTLYKISREFSVSVQDIKQWNNLKSDVIHIGQKLEVAKQQTSHSQDSEKVAPGPDSEITSEALAHLGAPYKWGGSSSSGFDCSGYIYHVFNEAGYDIKRQSSEGYFNRSYYVDKPELGDLVFFENTYKKGISHVGIYIGDEQFIHAGDNGVEISSLNNPYWKSKFDSFKRFY
ncbi:LysM peptidoglycan-binding domain-containing protein [Bacillus sp. Marseille-Q1617]|uniref:C40 family peptidase n=1 Tax=Bacillus sp. Marseille-Q1617 TaxID=2736887 RepID=UPI0020CA37D8|nr:peptidoglycan endopeptidase [Bacillus sp. Marseille-Q1617]